MDNNNNIKIKLNFIIFIDIQPYLLYNESFKRILEISLLNKSIFKSTQQIITHQQQLIKFYPFINSIFKYININNYEELNYIHNIPDSDKIKSKEENDKEIEKDKEREIIKKEKEEEEEDKENIEDLLLKKCNIEINNYNRYKFKLIQYKEIEILYCKSKSRIFKKIKEILLENFNSKKLKHVTFVNRIIANSYLKNPTCNGFFKFNKLYLYWDREDFPFSFPKENQDSNDLNVQETFEYSFDYLNRYKPKDIKIGTTGGDMKLNIKNLKNILNCKSIEKIKFSSIKSLYVRFSNDNDKSIGELFNDCEISNNSKLKELILLKNFYYDKQKKDPTLLLKSLIGNKTLTILGLQVFKLWNENEDWIKCSDLPRIIKYTKDDDIMKFSSTLSTLILIPTITTLHCEFHSLIPFLQHCNENSNINTLFITKGPIWGMKGRFPNGNYFNDYEIQFISNFFKKNQSLKVIGLKNKDYSNQLLGIINNNNINSKIIIKFIEKKKQ
ncbi:hypothetical protein ACTFIY_006476 [Dictyostelium cf. discoideum]